MLKTLINLKKVSKSFHFFYACCLVVFLSFPSYTRVYIFGGDFTQDRETPFIKLIQSAQEGDTIRMAAYKFTDKPIMDELIAAANRGATVRLLKEREIWLRPGSSLEDDGGENPDKYLTAGNAHIIIANTPPHFLQQHAKFISVTGKSGGERAIISTANFCDMDDQKTRTEGKPIYHDFAIDVSDPESIHNLTTVFDADMQGIPTQARAPEFESLASIVWGPDFQRSTFSKMIEEAKKEILIYQQDLQDEDIANKLARAAERGVKVRILMVEKPFGEKHGNKNLTNQTKLVKSSAHVNFVDPSSDPHLYIHAKIMVADGVMYIGSCNMYQPSIDQTRELGVLTRDAEDVGTVMKTFEKDWCYGTPLSVS